MTQKDKELLLKDLCARLPCFENWVQYDGKDYLVTGYGHGRVSLLPSMVSSTAGPCPMVEEVKPYLRPISSMTEEEAFEFGDTILNAEPEDLAVNKIDWLNEHHFDYRGLIEKGLAIEVTKDNNPYKYDTSGMESL